jgi:hypothetical protein
MNRLEAVRDLHNSYHSFSNGDGTYTMLIHIPKGQEWDEWPSGIYTTTSRTEGLGGCSPHFKDWRRMTWQEVRKLYHQAYPQRHSYQCEHRYESGARCTHAKDDPITASVVTRPPAW